MTHLIDIAYCLFTSFVTACFVFFWDFCTGEPDGQGGAIKGRIFSRIGFLLSGLHAKWEVEKSGRLNPYKAMGVCPLCFSVYVSAAMTLLAWWLLGMPLWYFLPVAVISMRFLRWWF